MQFLSEKFSLNGIESDSMNISLITFDDDVIRDFGNIYKQEMSIDRNLNGSPFYTKNLTDGDDIKLNLLFVEEDGFTPAKWTTDKVSEICNWVVSENFQPFISYDNKNIVYYIKCTNINKKMTNSMTGYLECSFKVFNNSAYYKNNINTEVNGTKTIEINNPSKHISSYKPIVKITNKSKKNPTLTLNGSSLTITGLPVNETIIIDNEMKTVNSPNGDNRLSLCNRKWIHLVEGVNLLEVTGDCRVEILMEIPVLYR